MVKQILVGAKYTLIVAKCKIPLELFPGNTGIGGYVIGACPHCKLEIDFTDCSKGET